MAQADITLLNTSRTIYRQNHNLANAAVASNFSGPTPPANPEVGQQWYDDVNEVMMRWSGLVWVQADADLSDLATKAEVAALYTGFTPFNFGPNVPVQNTFPFTLIGSIRAEFNTAATDVFVRVGADSGTATYSGVKGAGVSKASLPVEVPPGWWFRCEVIGAVTTVMQFYGVR